MQIVTFDEVNIDAGPHGYGCFDEASIAFRLSAVHYCSLFHACSLTHIRQDGACITQHALHSYQSCSARKRCQSSTIYPPVTLSSLLPLPTQMSMRPRRSV